MAAAVPVASAGCGGEPSPDEQVATDLRAIVGEREADALAVGPEHRTREALRTGGESRRLSTHGWHPVEVRADPAAGRRVPLGRRHDEDRLTVRRPDRIQIVARTAAIDQKLTVTLH